MRKKALICLTSAAILLILPTLAAAQDTCATIQSDLLYDSGGGLISTGYDPWGYNYQAHMFNGMYCDSYRDAAWCQPWADVELMMKWNDAWLSNEDCDADGFLDRHSGYDSYIGSGAWLTNHQSGTYTNPDGGRKDCRWNYFVKIIAVPTDAVLDLDSGAWLDGSGDEIGPSIWGQFAIIQQVDNDPCAGSHGLAYKGVRPGLGNWEDPDSVE